ncbi:hypothetical protein BU26DRAFT_252002 [Trematosphaeria pertusa]|uniref:F-box domain-containing protein n=1 Tax=Trematosphaeria pertusa TaxID=390896 RepID=A0A6A6INU6_9PLEO|nr:uncharacterized protein BU26DRAFT_252002 [Trematosphaeria pertusa]KAF2252141.1 hypothetical protein BU26DRAFT_252002 [Trematosphaeria pertusa]
MNETSPAPTTMDSLPNELFIQIAAHLDIEPPSVAKFAHEPSADITCANETPLKCLSQVSWRWRKIVVPILFRYTRIPLDKNPQWVPIDARLLESMQGQLTKLSCHEVQIYGRMRSKMKSSSLFAFEEAFDDLLINLCRIEDGDEFLKSAPNILWFPHLPPTFADFVRFVRQYELKHHIRSIVVYAEKEYELRHISTADAHLARVVAELWDQIFFRLEPARLVVAAPPATLAGLLDVQMLSSDAWAFDMKIHYIELLQPEPFRLKHRDAFCRPWNAALIHRRPWVHLGYNEGSSISAYSTYEYHLKQSPKMLYLVLVRLAKEVADCCNIRSFSFTGVFPFATNVTTLIKALQRISTLRAVEFQLCSGPENDLLDDPKRMGRAQRDDLWLEWRGSYTAIASFLGTYDFEDGSKFVSADCDAPDITKEVEEYVEVLQKRGLGWRKTGDGSWVRDHSLDREVVPTMANTDVED